mmetsp:Transcript_3973/g.7185  ORF Transcript_3973/g.7185 Transcript_3973/m.7185 type:complete len:238 (-) Transcript_3973:586-1299(-)
MWCRIQLKLRNELHRPSHVASALHWSSTPAKCTHHEKLSVLAGAVCAAPGRCGPLQHCSRRNVPQPQGDVAASGVGAARRRRSHHRTRGASLSNATVCNDVCPVVATPAAWQTASRVAAARGCSLGRNPLPRPRQVRRHPSAGSPGSERSEASLLRGTHPPRRCTATPQSATATLAKKPIPPLLAPPLRSMGPPLGCSPSRARKPKWSASAEERLASTVPATTQLASLAKREAKLRK